MRMMKNLCVVMLLSGLALAQSNAPSSSNVSDDLKQLREAIAQQQKQIADQQKLLIQQQQQLETLQSALEAKAAPHVENAGLKTVSTGPAPAQGDMQKPKESPLSFRIGGADFTPGGFVDFETVFRTTNTGSNIATGFGSIPFNNTIQGHLTELRMTGQYSRASLKMTSKYGDNDVTGYIEGDFNGNDAANVFVTANGHTARLRLYWLDLKRGKWEFLGGSSWGMITPTRRAFSPMPSDLATTYNADANVQVGIPYTRAGQLRIIYHPNDNWSLGVGIENPEQFVGAGEVIFPFAFNAALGPQFDAANQTSTPNAFPDVIPKIAYDSNFGKGQHFHFEAGGLLTNVKVTNVPIGGTTFVHHSTIGGSGFGAVNVDLHKSVRLVANALWGQGAGRYIIGLGPQAVVRPIQQSPTTFDLEPSMVRAGTALVGIELAPTMAPKSQFGVYYGGAYFGRNAFPDTTSPLVTKPFIGFGGLNSPNSANRAIQEATFDWTQTMWKNPQYGAIVLVTQASYLTRSPWFVATGAPKNAHLGMGYVSMRYILP
jgi:hypothetical protein